MLTKTSLKHILVNGGNGVGKTSLIEYISGKKKTYGRNISLVEGDDNSDISDLAFIDLPAMKDSYDNYEEYLTILKNKLEIEKPDSILFLIDFDQKKCSIDFKQQIKTLIKLFFSPDLKNHFAFVFTNASYSIPMKKYQKRIRRIQSKDMPKGIYTMSLDYLKEAVEELKKEDEKYSKIETPSEIKCFFVDSDLEMKGKPENQRTDEQIKEMLEWIRKNCLPKVNKSLYKRKILLNEDKIKISGNSSFYYHQYECIDNSDKRIIKTEEDWYKMTEEVEEYAGTEKDERILSTENITEINGGAVAGAAATSLGFLGGCFLTGALGAATILTAGAAAPLFGASLAGTGASLFGTAKIAENIEKKTGEKRRIEITTKEYAYKRKYEILKNGTKRMLTEEKILKKTTREQIERTVSC